MKQRDIILLEYPFSSSKGKKVRPALVVSNDAINKTSEDCILLPLTSVLKEEPYSLLITTTNLATGKLIVPSRIRIDRILSVKQSLAIKRIGSLKKSTFSDVKRTLLRLF